MLGSSERLIIGVLRTRRKASIRAIHQDLQADGHLLAYTTVSTILERLYHKGLVARVADRHRGGKRFIYRYVPLEEEEIGGVLRYLVSTFGPNGLAMFMDQARKLTPEEIKVLERGGSG